MKTVFVQNLISPYRAHFFNSLDRVDNNFGVYYLSRTEKDRNWDLSKIPIEHNCWIDKYGIYFMVKGFHIHINPVLILKILFSRSIKNVILCVSYCDISILALVLAKKLHLTNKRYFFWAEANYLTNGARKETAFKKWLRKFVFNSIDGGMIVPGLMAETTFRIWGFDINHFIHLPNTINDNALVFDANCDLRENNEQPVFLLPIRIIESLKGALNFFDAIGSDNVFRAKFIIAGDGEDKQMYQKYIVDNQYTEHIVLAGFCDESKMNLLYNSSDVLLLPSFSDPSPLTLVEGLKFHMPILCSEHCGNHYEAVEPGHNGYTFSPLDKNDIRNKFELLMRRRNDWKEMGEHSASIYMGKFETDTVVRNFLQQFKKVAM